ncbi:MAG: phage portal protein, partial [Devosia sp.]
MLSWTTNQAIWTDRNYEKLAEESYVRNAVAFKCVKLIASSAATVPWLMQDGDKEIDKHALLDLLSNPSPMIGGHALFEAYYAYLLLAGNSYLVAPLIGSGKRPPAELWNLRPDRMKIVPGPFGVPQAFEYTVNGQTKRFQVDPMTGAGEVLHVKEFHPTDDWYGLSRVQAGAYGIDRHNAASAHNKALLDNGARPSGALVFQPVKGDNGSERAAPQEVVDAARENLKERVGPKHAGEPFVFGGNVDWLEMGVTPKDMDFLKGKEDAARDICYAFGVPDILIVPGSSTYNNVAEAKLDLWEQTILPLIDHTLDALNSWLVPRYGNPNLRLGVDLDEISALEPRRESKRASVSKLLTDGVIDADEAREALQYGPRPPGALRLQRGDGPIIAALVAAAQADTGMLEPLYRYLVSAGLVDAGSTSLDAFITQWD